MYDVITLCGSEGDSHKKSGRMIRCNPPRFFERRVIETRLHFDMAAVDSDIEYLIDLHTKVP